MKKPKCERLTFYLGSILSILSALFMFFDIADLSTRIVLIVIGIVLIATSGCGKINK